MPRPAGLQVSVGTAKTATEVLPLPPCADAGAAPCVDVIATMEATAKATAPSSRNGVVKARFIAFLSDGRVQVRYHS